MSVPDLMSGRFCFGVLKVVGSVALNLMGRYLHSLQTHLRVSDKPDEQTVAICETPNRSTARSHSWD